MKNLAFLLCLSIATVTMAAQQTSTHAGAIRYDRYPRARAQVMHLDKATARLLPMNATDIRILDQGRTYGIDSISCPEPGTSLPISSVLTIDVSGSMAKGAPNISLARAAADAWIDALGNGSECAITSFDHRHYLNIDFTSDKARLSNALNDIQPRGGTNYEQAFVGDPYGGLRVAATGRHRRVLVFLTDGLGEGRMDHILAAAREANTTVYCVSLGMTMPGILKNVAEETGGLWFENVTTVGEAVMAYKRIYTAATTNDGCTIWWTPPAACAPVRDMTFIVGNDTVSATLRTPDSLVARAVIAPASASFGIVAAGATATRTVTIKATNAPVRIDRIASANAGPIRLSGTTFPVDIATGDSLVLTLTYAADDTSYVVSRFDIDASPCPLPPLYVSAGSLSSPPRQPTIHVVYPNGGERLWVNRTAELRYDGVPPDAPVRLDVSYDDGRTWNVIAGNVRGHRYTWKAPSTPSDSCLLRVSQEVPTTARAIAEPVTAFKGQTTTSAVITADGSMVMTAGGGTLRFLDAEDGRLLSSIDGVDEIMSITDGTTLIGWTPGTVLGIDIPTKAVRWRHALPTATHTVAVEASRQARRLLIAGGMGDSTAVLDYSKGTVVATLPRNKPTIRWATISPYGESVAICEMDSVVRVIDVGTKNLLYEIRTPNVARYYRTAFSPDGALLSVADGSGTTTLHDARTGVKIRNLSQRQYVNDNTYVSFSADGSRAALETGRDQTKIVETATGRDLVTIQRSPSSGSVSDAIFSPDGTTIMLLSPFLATVFDAQTGVQIAQYRRHDGTPSFTAAGDQVVVVNAADGAGRYDIGATVVQQDVSDRRWALIQTKAIIKDVRFAPRYVGTSKDSVVTAAIVNTGTVPLDVVSITLEGSQAMDFGLRTEGGFTLQPGESRNLEYSFHPTRQGELATLAIAQTQAGALRARITGRALASLLDAASTTIDMGSVPLTDSRTKTPDVMLKNTGTADVRITGIRLGGPDNRQFAIDAGTTPTLKPGETFTFPITLRPERLGRTTTTIEFRIAGLDDPVVAIVNGEGIDVPVALSDPTTFRTIMLPSAVIPPAGTITTGIYDVVGLQAGASVHDNVMILAGGLVPVPSRWFGATGYNASMQYAYSLGVKVGTPVGKDVVVGGGYQFGQSTYDQDFSVDRIDSRITFNTLWATVGYGDDDHRINAYAGYAFKRHVTAFEGSFDADATIFGLGGDYRIGHNWKLCIEGFFMRTMPVVPVTAVVRYFGETYALEAGITVTAIPASGATAPSLPIVPMLTWVKRW